MQIHERLEEMGLFYRMGGTSADHSGSDVLQRLVDGEDEGFGSGGGVRGMVGPWIASRVAETARACLSLHEDDQATVCACYCEPLANQALQAASLNIKPSALQKRLRRIHLLLEDWLSPEAKEKRRITALWRREKDSLRMHALRSEEIRQRAELTVEQRAALARGETGKAVRRAGKRRKSRKGRKAAAPRIGLQNQL